MSGVFSKPRTPDVAAAEQIDEIETIEEDETEVRKREKRRLASGGRRGTMLSGIQSALKKRLGE